MRIGHYMHNMFEPGGIASYIRRIAAAQTARGDQIFFLDRAPQITKSPEPVEFITDDAHLARRARELQLDIVHLHMNVTPAAIHAIPAVRTVHTHSPYCPSQGRFLKRSASPCNRNYSLLGCLWGHAIDRCGSVRPGALLRNFSTTHAEMKTLANLPVIAISQFIKDQMIRAGYPANQIEVLHLPGPPPRDYLEPPRDGPPRLLYLGRMIPHKGVDWLLRAMARTKPPLMLDLAGTGNQEADYRALATSLGLTDRVTFHDWVDQPGVENLLRQSRALVFPSLWHEPAGLVSLDAMASGRAVILSNVGGAIEMVEKDASTLVVEPGDEQALAAAMQRLADDHDLARRLGIRGREIATQRFTLDQHMQKLDAIYRRAG